MLKEIGKNTFEVQTLSGDMVEIGDKALTAFKPHLRLNRFHGERFIDLSLPVTEKSLPIIDGDKITWEGHDRHIIIYPLAPDKQMTQGGYEYEIVLNKKPPTNKIVIDLIGQGLKFCYQPELTSQEIEEGVHVPDNIIGSYAVYHDSKGGMVTPQDVAKGITTGLAFCIYRPRIVDARGDWMWEEQFIDPITGKQIIAIPQEFLETAHYPIRHVAGDTFGYTDVGGLGSSIGAYVAGSQYASGVVGTGVSITANFSTWSAGKKIKCALYDAALDIVANGTTEEKVSQATGWTTFNFSVAPDIVNANYTICVWADGAQVTFSRAADEGVDRWWFVTVYNGWAASLPASDRTGKFSIYCTYTPAAAGWANIASLRQGTGEIASADMANIRMGTGSIAVADIAKIGGVAV